MSSCSAMLTLVYCSFGPAASFSSIPQTRPSSLPPHTDSNATAWVRYVIAVAPRVVLLYRCMQ